MKDYSTKWLTFKQTTPKTKTQVWLVYQDLTSSIIGEVRWHAHWRRYNFFPDKACFTMDANCMEELAKHCRELQAEWKRGEHP